MSPAGTTHGVAALAAALLLQLSACSPGKTVVKPEALLSADAVIAGMARHKDDIRTLYGSGTITIESPELSRTGTFDLQLRRPDSLLLNFQGPFGLGLATLQLTRTRFVLYNRLDNSALVGTPNTKTFLEFLHLPLEFSEILGAFSGDFPSPSGGDSLRSFSTASGDYRAEFSSSGDRKTYRIDGQSLLVTDYKESGPDGVRLHASSQDQEETDGVLVPHLLRLMLPAERRSLTIAYDDVTVNRPVNCAYTIPKQADIIRQR
jgi:hypothetical protein